MDLYRPPKTKKTIKKIEEDSSRKFKINDSRRIKRHIDQIRYRLISSSENVDPAPREHTSFVDPTRSNIQTPVTDRELTISELDNNIVNQLPIISVDSNKSININNGTAIAFCII